MRIKRDKLPLTDGPTPLANEMNAEFQRVSNTDELISCIKRYLPLKIDYLTQASEWYSVLDKLDEYFETILSTSRYHLVLHDVDVIKKTPITAKSEIEYRDDTNVLKWMLKLTIEILNYSSNKDVYNSTEYLVELLRSFDDELLILATTAIEKLTNAPLTHRWMYANENIHHTTTFHGNTTYSTVLFEMLEATFIANCNTSVRHLFSNEYTLAPELKTVQIDASSRAKFLKASRIVSGHHSHYHSTTSHKDLGAHKKDQVLPDELLTQSADEYLFTIMDIYTDTRDLRTIMDSIQHTSVSFQLKFAYMTAIRMRRMLNTHTGRKHFIQLQYQCTSILLTAFPEATVLYQFFQDKIELMKDFLYLLRTGPGTTEYESMQRLASPSIAPTNSTVLSTSAEFSAMTGIKRKKTIVVPFEIRLNAIQCLMSLTASSDEGADYGSIFFRYPWLLFELGVNRGQYMGLIPCLIRSAASYLLAFNSKLRNDINLQLLWKRVESPDNGADAAAELFTEVQALQQCGLYDVTHKVTESAETEAVMDSKMDVDIATNNNTSSSTGDVHDIITTREYEQLIADYERLIWIERTFLLVNSLVQFSAIVPALSDNGLINSILPILKPAFIGLNRPRVALYVEILTAEILDLAVTNTQSALVVFREQKGVELCLQRLLQELVVFDVDRICTLPVESMVQTTTATAADASAGVNNNSTTNVMSLHDVNTNGTITITTTVLAHSPSTIIPIQNNIVIQELLSLLSSYLQDSRQETVAIHKQPEFLAAFQLVLHYSARLGKAVLSSALSYLAEVLNYDTAPPTTVNFYLSSNLGKSAISILQSKLKDDITTEIVQALIDIVSGLCLTSDGQQLVIQHNPFVDIFSLFLNPNFYYPHSRVLMDGYSASLSGSIEELVRHYPNMLSYCMLAFREQLETLLQRGEVLLQQQQQQETEVCVMTDEYLLVLHQLESIFGVMDAVLLKKEHTDFFINDMNGMAMMLRTLALALGPARYFLNTLATTAEATMFSVGYYPVVTVVLRFFSQISEVDPLLLLKKVLVAIDSATTDLEAQIEQYWSNFGDEILKASGMTDEAVASTTISAAGAATNTSDNITALHSATSTRSSARNRNKSTPTRAAKVSVNTATSSSSSNSMNSNMSSSNSILSTKAKIHLLLETVTRLPVYQYYDDCNASMSYHLQSFTAVLKAFAVLDFLIEAFGTCFLSKTGHRVAKECIEQLNLDVNINIIKRIVLDIYVPTQLEMARVGGVRFTKNCAKVHPVYRLLVVAAETVMVRESVEDTSKKVCKLAKGVQVDAYERKFGSGGVLKYRIDEGWVGVTSGTSISAEPKVIVLDTSAKPANIFEQEVVKNNTAFASSAAKMEFDRLANASPRRGGFSSLFHFHFSVKNNLIGGLAKHFIEKEQNMGMYTSDEQRTKINPYTAKVIPILKQCFIELIPDYGTTATSAGNTTTTTTADLGVSIESTTTTEPVDTSTANSATATTTKSGKKGSTSSKSKNKRRKKATEPENQPAKTCDSSSTIDTPFTEIKTVSNIPTLEEFGLDKVYLSYRVAELCHAAFFDSRRQRAEINWLLLAHLLYDQQLFEKIMFITTRIVLVSLNEYDKDITPLPGHELYTVTPVDDDLFDAPIAHNTRAGSSKRVNWADASTAKATSATDELEDAMDIEPPLADTSPTAALRSNVASEETTKVSEYPSEFEDLRDEDIEEEDDDDSYTADDTATNTNAITSVDKSALLLKYKRFRRKLKDRRSLAVTLLESAVDVWKLFYTALTAPPSSGANAIERCLDTEANAEHEFNMLDCKRQTVFMMTKHLSSVFDHKLLCTLPPTYIRSMLDLMIVAYKALSDVQKMPLTFTTRNSRPVLNSSRTNSEALAMSSASWRRAVGRSAVPPVPAAEAFSPQESTITTLEEMGFTRSAVVRAMTMLRSNNANQVVPFLLENPFMDDVVVPASAAATASSASPHTGGTVDANVSSTSANAASSSSPGAVDNITLAAAAAGDPMPDSPRHYGANLAYHRMAAVMGRMHSIDNLDLFASGAETQTTSKASEQGHFLPLIPKKDEYILNLEKQAIDRLLTELDTTIAVICYGLIETGISPSANWALLDPDINQQNTKVTHEVFTIMILNQLIRCFDRYRGVESGIGLRTMILSKLLLRVDALTKPELVKTPQVYTGLHGLLHAILVLITSKLSSQNNSRPAVTNEIIYLVLNLDSRYKVISAQLVQLLHSFVQAHHDVITNMATTLSSATSTTTTTDTDANITSNVAKSNTRTVSSISAHWIAPAIMILDTISQPILIDHANLSSAMSEIDSFTSFGPTGFNATTSSSSSALNRLERQKHSFLPSSVKSKVEDIKNKCKFGWPLYESLNYSHTEKGDKKKADDVNYTKELSFPLVELGLEQTDKERCVEICCKLLHYLPSIYSSSDITTSGSNVSGSAKASVTSITQAGLQFLTHLTRSNDLRNKFVALEGAHAVLQCKASFPGLASVAFTLLQQYLEDDNYLYQAMSAIVRLCYIRLTRTSANSNASTSNSDASDIPLVLKNLIEVVAPLIYRNQSIFMRAFCANLEIKKVGASCIVTLKKSESQQVADFKAAEATTIAASATTNTSNVDSVSGGAAETSAAKNHEAATKAVSTIGKKSKRNSSNGTTDDVTKTNSAAIASSSSIPSSSCAAGTVKSNKKAKLEVSNTSATDVTLVSDTLKRSGILSAIPGDTGAAAATSSASTAKTTAMATSSTVITKPTLSSGSTVLSVVDDICFQIAERYTQAKELSCTNTGSNAIEMSKYNSFSISDLLIILADLGSALQSVSNCVLRYHISKRKSVFTRQNTSSRVYAAVLPITDVLTHQPIASTSFITFVIHSLLLSSQFPPKLSDDNAEILKLIVGDDVKDACCYFLAALLSRSGGESRTKVLNELLTAMAFSDPATTSTAVATVGTMSHAQVPKSQTVEKLVKLKNTPTANTTEQLQSCVVFAETLLKMFSPPAKWVQRDSFVHPTKEILISLTKMNAIAILHNLICLVDMNHPLACDTIVQLCVAFEFVLKKGLPLVQQEQKDKKDLVKASTDAVAKKDQSAMKKSKQRSNSNTSNTSEPIAATTSTTMPATTATANSSASSSAGITHSSLATNRTASTAINRSTSTGIASLNPTSTTSTPNGTSTIYITAANTATNSGAISHHNNTSINSRNMDRSSLDTAIPLSRGNSLADSNLSRQLTPMENTQNEYFDNAVSNLEHEHLLRPDVDNNVSAEFSPDSFEEPDEESSDDEDDNMHINEEDDESDDETGDDDDDDDDDDEDDDGMDLEEEEEIEDDFEGREGGHHSDDDDEHHSHHHSHDEEDEDIYSDEEPEMDEENEGAAQRGGRGRRRFHDPANVDDRSAVLEFDDGNTGVRLIVTNGDDEPDDEYDVQENGEEEIEEFEHDDDEPNYIDEEDGVDVNDEDDEDMEIDEPDAERNSANPADFFPPGFGLLHSFQNILDNRAPRGLPTSFMAGASNDADESPPGDHDDEEVVGDAASEGNDDDDNSWRMFGNDPRTVPGGARTSGDISRLIFGGGGANRANSTSRRDRRGQRFSSGSSGAFNEELQEFLSNAGSTTNTGSGARSPENMFRFTIPSADLPTFDFADIMRGATSAVNGAVGAGNGRLARRRGNEAAGSGAVFARAMSGGSELGNFQQFVSNIFPNIPMPAELLQGGARTVTLSISRAGAPGAATSSMFVPTDPASSRFSRVVARSNQPPVHPLLAATDVRRSRLLSSLSSSATATRSAGIFSALGAPSRDSNQNLHLDATWNQSRGYSERRRALGPIVSDRRWGTDIGDNEAVGSRLPVLVSAVEHALSSVDDDAERSNRDLDVDEQFNRLLSRQRGFSNPDSSDDDANDEAIPRQFHARRNITHRLAESHIGPEESKEEGELQESKDNTEGAAPAAGSNSSSSDAANHSSPNHNRLSFPELFDQLRARYPELVDAESAAPTAGGISSSSNTANNSSASTNSGAATFSDLLDDLRTSGMFTRASTRNPSLGLPSRIPRPPIAAGSRNTDSSTRNGRDHQSDGLLDLIQTMHGSDDAANGPENSILSHTNRPAEDMAMETDDVDASNTANPSSYYDSRDNLVEGFAYHGPTDGTDAADGDADLLGAANLNAVASGNHTGSTAAIDVPRTDDSNADGINSQSSQNHATSSATTENNESTSNGDTYPNNNGASSNSTSNILTDNVAFIESLPSDLREEVLLSSDEAFLATLTTGMQTEARVLQDRTAMQIQMVDYAGLTDLSGGNTHFNSSSTVPDSVVDAATATAAANASVDSLMNIVASGDTGMFDAATELNSAPSTEPTTVAQSAEPAPRATANTSSTAATTFDHPDTTTAPQEALQLVDFSADNADISVVMDGDQPVTETCPFNSVLLARLFRTLFESSRPKWPKAIFKVLALACKYNPIRKMILNAIVASLHGDGERMVQAISGITSSRSTTSIITSGASASNSGSHSNSTEELSQLQQLVIHNVGTSSHTIRRLLGLVSYLLRKVDKLVWFDVLSQNKPTLPSTSATNQSNTSSNTNSSIVTTSQPKTSLFAELLNLLAHSTAPSTTTDNSSNQRHSLDIDYLLQLLEELSTQFGSLNVLQANKLYHYFSSQLNPTQYTNMFFSNNTDDTAAPITSLQLKSDVDPQPKKAKKKLPRIPENAELPDDNRANPSSGKKLKSRHPDTDKAKSAATTADAVDKSKQLIPFPVLTNEEVHVLCTVAGSDACLGVARKKLMRIMRCLSLADGNWNKFLEQLVVVGSDIARRAVVQFTNLHATLVNVSQEHGDAAMAMSLPQLSTPVSIPEVRLLNVLRLMTVLRPRSSTSAAVESDLVSSFIRRIECTVLWDLLCDCLDVVRDIEGLEELMGEDIDNSMEVVENENDVNDSSDNSDGNNNTSNNRNTSSSRRNRSTGDAANRRANIVSSNNRMSVGSNDSQPANLDEKHKKLRLSSLIMRFMPLIECFLTVCASTILIRPTSTDSSTSGGSHNGATPATPGAGLASKSMDNSFLRTLSGIKRKADTAGVVVETPADINQLEPELQKALALVKTSTMLPGTRFRQHSAYQQMQVELDDVDCAKQLISFAERNHILLNMVLRHNVHLLEASFSPLVVVPRCRQLLHFDIKRAYFKMKLKRMRQSSGARLHGSLRIAVRRNRIFDESFQQLRYKSSDEMRRRLSVSFHGEEGMDAGGLTREWYTVLAREIFNPNYALFMSTGDGVTFQPNPQSSINPDHLSYFKFVGRVIGKAICDGQLLDAHFTRSFYKHMLGLPVSFQDLEAIEPDYYKSLKQILEVPLDLLGVELNFSAENNDFGKVEVVDLIPNGRNFDVNDNNKLYYVKLIAHHRMTTAIRAQIDAFLEGFHELVPAELISLFDAQELELLISGLPDIDLDDLRANTEYHGFKPSDVEITHFWNVLKSFNKEEKASFLQFVTGTSKVPLDGFQALHGSDGIKRFNIHKTFGSSAQLPAAHTCFNQLDLPVYPSEEVTRDKMLLAIKEGCTGFGFA